MRSRYPSRYLLILLISVVSASGLFIILNKTFGLEQRFEERPEQQESDYKFRLPGLVISYVNRLYVDPDRIDNIEMFKGALSLEERIIPEVLCDYEEETNTEKVAVDEVSKTFDLSQIERSRDMFRVLQEALTFINTHREQNERIKTSDIEYSAINGMLTQLDPHSVILPPKQFDEFKIGTSGKFGGLGMVVGIRDGVLTVISPIEGTPAARAGMKPGDKIVEIDGESTIDMNLTESVGKLRGDPGTNVTLSVLKHKAVQPKLVTVKREIIVIPTVESASLNGGFGYIRIRNFQDDTSERLGEHLSQLKKEISKINGLIIDLRNNSGGLLDQAIKVSDKFLPGCPIVVTVGPGGHPREIVDAKEAKTDEEKYPLVVLVDAGSASGAEIVAGALKENKRAIIIGDRTFGKGSVQQLIELMDGSALKLTIAKYLTPLFTDIQSFGITPNIRLVPVTVARDNINLFHGIAAIREKDLKKHLDNKHKKEKPFETVRYFHETEEEKEGEDAKDEEPAEDEDPYKLPDFDKDFHIIFAKRLLMNEAAWKKEEVSLQNFLPVIEEVSMQEEEKIAHALQELGIDWSADDSKGKPSSKVTFATMPENKKVKAGEKIAITVDVENTGDAPFYQLRGISSSENGLYDKHEFIFGKVDPGEKKSYSSTIDIPKNSLDREDEVTIKFEELNQNNPEDLTFTIVTEALPRPRFAFSYQILDPIKSSEKNNGDGLISKGEEIELLVILKNVGEGIAEKSVVNLKNLSDKNVFVKKGRVEIGQLNPGETEKAKLSFVVKEEIGSEDFHVDLVTSDSTFGTFLKKKLDFRLANNTPDIKTTANHLEIKKIHTPLYGGMSFDSPVLSMMKEKMILRSDAKSSEWYRVNLPGDDRYGWIAAKDVNVLNGEVEKEIIQVSDLKPYVQQIPPTITMKGKPNALLLFGKDQLALSAVVKDDVQVKHAYVLINNDKVFFKSNKYGSPQQRATLEINTDHSLEEGPNVVTIVARDDQNLISVKSFVATKGTVVASGS